LIKFVGTLVSFYNLLSLRFMVSGSGIGEASMAASCVSRDMMNIQTVTSVEFPSSANTVVSWTGGLLHGLSGSLMLLWLMIATIPGCGGDGGGSGSSSSSGSSPVVSSANILWTDGIQAGTADNWGFDYMMTERPVGTSVTPSDANGANISRVADPLGGAGYALRFYTNFGSSAGGARAEVDLLSQSNTAFAAQAKSAEGIWVAQQWYFPQALSAGNDDYPWLNLWDWHSVSAGDRWHTSPGVMVAKDGSMKVQFVWGGGSASYNSTTGYSSIAMPVGRWFSVEMHYVWSASTVTVSLWIDGALALEQTVARTRADAHTGVEMNIKSYGATQGRTAWTPTPFIRYVRNVRFADGPITVR
jgi:hypothetical protein